ncbi:hypothetical protein [Carnobacterium maltaromaticum]|uniref:hypothetical protein n=1 Tax=Carnobacterium maltaromaticum TaxID=2751 RepID=UPI001E140913|nr:hypothetical protein [Carnobacterium maltaromaticum]MCC4313463.1 hypothetical protein [Carnobacterium maltaromaticum]
MKKLIDWKKVFGLTGIVCLLMSIILLVLFFIKIGESDSRYIIIRSLIYAIFGIVSTTLYFSLKNKEQLEHLIKNKKFWLIQGANSVVVLKWIVKNIAYIAIRLLSWFIILAIFEELTKYTSESEIKVIFSTLQSFLSLWLAVVLVLVYLKLKRPRVAVSAFLLYFVFAFYRSWDIKLNPVSNETIESIISFFVILGVSFAVITLLDTLIREYFKRTVFMSFRVRENEFRKSPEYIQENLLKHYPITVDWQEMISHYKSMLNNDLLIKKEGRLSKKDIHCEFRMKYSLITYSFRYIIVVDKEGIEDKTIFHLVDDYFWR